MERTRGSRLTKTELTEPLIQFSCGLAGEREGEDPAWVQSIGRCAVGDTSGEDTGLARASAGADHEQGRVGRDRLQLLGVETGKDLIGGTVIHTATLPIIGDCPPPARTHRLPAWDSRQTC